MKIDHIDGFTAEMKRRVQTLCSSVLQISWRLPVVAPTVLETRPERVAVISNEWEKDELQLTHSSSSSVICQRIQSRKHIKVQSLELRPVHMHVNNMSLCTYINTFMDSLSN